MDEALGECAIDISGRPFCAFDAELPRRDDRGLRRRADRGVLPRGRQHLEDDAAPLGPLRLERPPHDRGRFKAFARALREAVSIDPGESGVPSTKGTLTE